MNLIKIILLFLLGGCSLHPIFAQASAVGLSEAAVGIEHVAEASEALIDSSQIIKELTEPNYLKQGLVFTFCSPWYKTLWGNLFYGIFIFFSFYFIHLIRINRVKKYEMQRTKISSDLQHDVGGLLTSVAMQSEVLELNASEENKKLYNTFSYSIRDAMGKMRDTVWAIDSRRDSMGSLVDRMEDHVMDLSNAGLVNVNFNHYCNKLTRDLQPDMRQNIYLIFKEALNNSINYRNGDQVNIQLSCNRKFLRLTIHDNGAVDPEKLIDLRVGLRKIKMRTRRINGQIKIDSNNGFKLEVVVD